MTPDSTDRRMQSPDPHSPLGGLSPADLLRQGAAEDTLLDGAREAFEPPSLLELAAIFPQFEILELIGQGGMGAVYKVRQRQLDRVVALKILPPGIGGEGAFADRFAREAKALAKLNHPGIVTIHEFGCSGGLYFIVMEFVDGVNLRQLLKGGRIAPREALAIVPQICDALQFAHDLGIVHRDIKPENLLIDRRGRVKVADFGLAKLVGGNPDEEAAAIFASGSLQTEGGKVMGTPRYMAPEQIERPAEVDHRADIYALGVVFYQMLTGELPGERLEAPSRKVSVDVRLDEIVLRALEKDPELRFQQASMMKTRVEETREGGSAGGGKSQVPKRALAGIVLQAVALLLLLTGLRDVWKTPEGVQTVGIYEPTGNQGPMELEAGLKEILTKLDPGAALARTADGKQWWVSVVAADTDAGGIIHRRFSEEILARFGAVLEAREMRTSYAVLYGKMALLKPRWLLAGAWAGAIGAALLAISPMARSGAGWRWAGPVALGVFLAALLGTGALLVLYPSNRDSAFGFGCFALVAASAFGVVGWRSAQGRAVVLGASALVFAWVVAVPWEFSRFPHGPGPHCVEVKGHQP